MEDWEKAYNKWYEEHWGYVPGPNECKVEWEACWKYHETLRKESMELARFYGDVYHWDREFHSNKYSNIEDSDLDFVEGEEGRSGGKRARQFLAKYSQPSGSS